MLNKLELKKLPFVDTCPEPDQKRIQWVRNGECPAGATTKYGNDGNLNAAGVGIFSDVLLLEENSHATKDSLNVVIDNVNNINKALEMGTDVDVIKQIAQNKENIEILQVHMQYAESNIGELEVDVEFLKEDIGVYDPTKDPVMRPVRGDIVFLKTELGNYPDQDMNGNSSLGSPSTGIKRRVIDNTTAISSVTNRVKKLEDDYQDSDVGSLSIKVNELREDMGPHIEGIGKPSVYARLSHLESHGDSVDSDIQSIKSAISFNGSQTIGSRMTSVEKRTSDLETTVNTPITGLVARVSANEKSIGVASEPLSINGRLTTLRTDHDALAIVVGKDASSGLRGTVALHSQIIGSTVNPAQGTILNRLSVAEQKIVSSDSKIQDLQQEIGTNKSGLKGSVLQLSQQMDGKNPQGSTLEEIGVYKMVGRHQTEISRKISDAPVDGNEYVRKSGAWTVASAFGAAADVEKLKIDMAAVEARLLAVENKAADNTNRIKELENKVIDIESRLSTKVEAAPMDGEAYVNQNGSWVLLSTFLTP